MTYDNGQEVEAEVCDEEARNGLADKQGKSDSALRTTAKTIVGAINELFVGLGDKQNKRDTDLSTVSKNIVGAINELLASIGLKQSKTDNELSTTQKTIVGAINGIDTRVKAIEEGGGGGGGGGDATTLQGHPASYFAKASDLVSTNQAVSGLQSGLELTNDDVDELDTRVTALEQGGGGGGLPQWQKIGSVTGSTNTLQIPSNANEVHAFVNSNYNNIVWTTHLVAEELTGNYRIFGGSWSTNIYGTASVLRVNNYTIMIDEVRIDTNVHTSNATLTVYYR